MIASTLLLAASLAAAPAPQGEPATARSLLVRCGTLHPGDGPPLRDAWLVIRDGKIREVGQGEGAPADLPVLDASDRVVMPGIVAADTDLAGVGDSDYNVTPDFVALDGFDFARSFAPALSGGVTSAYLAAGRNRLIPGQGAVVKLFGDDAIARVVADAAALQITLGTASTRSPRLFEPTVSPTSDDPLLPARRQYPSARISQLATLRDVFADASSSDAALLGPGAVEDHYESAALRRVVARQLPLRIRAHEARDVLQALRLGEELGARVVLDEPWQVAEIAARAAAAGASAVIRVPVAISASNPGGEDRRDESVRNVVSNAAAAAAAGLCFALAPERDTDLDDYLFVAGIAIRNGLAPEAALRAITADAARTLGVDDRVGTLAPGKDADFLVLSGEPFAVGTMVEQTFVDGVRAWQRHADEELLAVRARRILTVAGPVLHNGTILVAGGKIKALGEELAVPYGARVLDLGSAFVTPGFIDSFTSLGLAGEGTGIPNGAPEQRVADALRWDDPAFATARAAGLTTLLVAGPDGQSVSGRVAAVKTGARAADSFVVRDTAALRIVHDAVGADAVKPLRDLLERGRKYIESWKKYDKDLADWKAGKERPPEPEQKPDAAPSDPVSGTWECTLSDLPVPAEIGLVLRLELHDKTVTGKAEIRFGERERPPMDIENGKFENGTLTLDVRFMRSTSTLHASLADDLLEGTIELMGTQATVTGKRTSKDATKTASSADDGGGEPKAPKVDEALEPVRALLEKRIPAVVRVNRAPAIADVIELFRKEDLKLVLQEVGDAIDTPAILGEQAPPVVLGPELVEREKGEIVNAAATLADRQVELAFASGDTAGCRYLPLHAAHAIRWGLDPDAALRALTIGPARMFGIDDRVGSLERGKDADFVAFSGNPFELTSRVLLVVCDGQVVAGDAAPRSDR